MPLVSPLIASFNAGEFTPLLSARADFQKYRNACEKLENWIPLIQGGAMKRPGTRFVAEARDSTQNTRVIEFEFNTQQAYILEFSHHKMRVFRDGAATVLLPRQTITAATQENPVRITSAAHGYSNGDRILITDVVGMVELNNREHTVTAATTNTFQLQGVDGTGYTSYGSGGEAAEIFEIDSPYAADDLDGIQFAQSADVLYLAHRDYPPQKVERTGHTMWTITEIDFEWAPFLEQNNTGTTVYVSATTGSVNITASSGIFTASDVGRLFRVGLLVASRYKEWEAGESVSVGDHRRWQGNVYVSASTASTGTRPPIHRIFNENESDGGVTWTYKHSGFGYAEITAFTSSTQVTATVVRDFPDRVVGSTLATTRWAWGAWDATSGFPRAVTFHQDRLWWAGTKLNSQALWASKPGDFENHERTDDDESAIFVTLNTDQVNAIEWLRSRQRFLCGTAGAEFAIRAASADEAITAANIEAIRQTSYGSASSVHPIGVESAVLFVQREKRKVRELVFNFDTDSLVGPDLTVLAEHITGGRIKWMAFAQEPFRLVWVVLEDGSLRCLTYERTQDVVAWHRHAIGGTDVEVESIAAIPRSDGLGDQLWMVVKRTIGGATVRHIEYLEREWRETDDAEDAFFVDSGLTYDGSAATEISGLFHLEGETVKILADGAAHRDLTVAGGKITLDDAASVVQVGLQYSAILKTLRLSDGNPAGTGQSKTQRISHLNIRAYQLGPGLSYGPDESNLVQVHLRDSDDAMDAPVPLLDGDVKDLKWPGGYAQDTAITLKHDLPFPATILALLPVVHVEALR